LASTLSRSVKDLKEIRNPYDKNWKNTWRGFRKVKSF
jgi:hypothetical protein